ncbi:hypothetical protein U1Q18_052016 [Sarracenia purpurea var. burkii]
MESHSKQKLGDLEREERTLNASSEQDEERRETAKWWYGFNVRWNILDIATFVGIQRRVWIQCTGEYTGYKPELKFDFHKVNFHIDEYAQQTCTLGWPFVERYVTDFDVRRLDIDLRHPTFEGRTKLFFNFQDSSEKDACNQIQSGQRAIDDIEVEVLNEIEDDEEEIV